MQYWLPCPLLSVFFCASTLGGKEDWSFEEKVSLGQYTKR